MFRKILKIVGWLLLLAFLGFTFWFTKQELKKVTCQNVSIQIMDGSPRYLNENDILELVQKADNSILGKNLNSINTDELEKKLRAAESIKSAEVYRRISNESLRFKGKLIVEIEERNPIIRFKTDMEDYYMDEMGAKIQASSKFTSKVLLVTGSVNDPIATKEILAFAGYVYSNLFWKAQLEQVLVKPNNELFIIPQVGDHVIQFGTAANYKEKLRNLKAVYQEAFNKTGWEKYDTLNLKYKNQVVCNKIKDYGQK